MSVERARDDNDDDKLILISNLLYVCPRDDLASASVFVVDANNFLRTARAHLPRIQSGSGCVCTRQAHMQNFGVMNILSAGNTDVCATIVPSFLLTFPENLSSGRAPPTYVCTLLKFMRA